MDSSARARRRFNIVLALSSLVALVPLWVPRWLPLLDLPDNLDAVALWTRHHDASWGLARFYDLNFVALPYWLYLLPVRVLSFALPIEVANKIYLSAYAIALPFSVAALAERMNRNRWLALFSLPLVFSFNLAGGFVTFCGGVVVMLFALATLDHFLEAPTRRRAIALTLLTLALYFSHVLPWMFFGVASLVLALCHGWRPRRMLAAAACEFPSLLFACYGFHAAATHATAVQPGPIAYEAYGELLINRLRLAPTRILAGWADDGAMWILLLLGAAWLFLLLTASDEDRPPSEEAEKPVLHRYRLEALTLLALVAYLTLPSRLLKPVELSVIGARFLPIAAIFGALLPSGNILGGRRFVLAAVAAIAVAFPILTAVHWWRYDQRAAGFRALMQKVPRGKSTLVLVLDDGRDPDADPAAAPYTEYHAYAQLLAGGFDPWASPTGFPARVRREAALPAPPWQKFRDFSVEKYDAWDYILTKGETGAHEVFGPDGGWRARIEGRQGAFRLYSVRK
jgi:hypothetical protein